MSYCCSQKMKISLVIPTYTINDNLKELAIRAVLSYRSQVDELIITEDGGMFVQELFDLSDIYLRGKHNIGFTSNTNRGWKLAKGDFVMIANSDTELYRGLLKDLCIPGRVTSPVIVTQEIPLLAGPFWCAPQGITKIYGYLNEDMRTYTSDSEYEHRVQNIFQKVPSVRIYHVMEQTILASGINKEQELAKDRLAYKKLLKPI